MEQKPSIGRIVIYRFPDTFHPSNSLRDCPAIVTAVWSDSCVNLRLLRDANQPEKAASEMGDTPTSVNRAEGETVRGHTWRWPERV